MMFVYETDTHFNEYYSHGQREVEDRTGCLLFCRAYQEINLISECFKSEYLSDIQELTAPRNREGWGGWEKKAR